MRFLPVPTRPPWMSRCDTRLRFETFVEITRHNGRLNLCRPHARGILHFAHGRPNLTLMRGRSDTLANRLATLEQEVGRLRPDFVAADAVERWRSDAQALLFHLRDDY